MYTWEIANKLQEHNYDLPSKVYCDICSTSPQISRVKYEPFSNEFRLWTKDNGDFTFHVHPSNTNNN